MTDYLNLVREFHQKYGHPIADRPSIPDDEVVNLRFRLIEEEMMETLGVLRDIMNDPSYDEREAEHLTALADGIADSIVVLMGTVLSFGLPIEKIFEEIHKNNMSKGMTKDEFGKTLKGPNWVPPNIREIIENERQDTSERTETKSE